jgi:hypothetical protein
MKPAAFHWRREALFWLATFAQASTLCALVGLAAGLLAGALHHFF